MCKLYIDDIKIDVWDSNTIHADGITASEYSVTGIADGDHWFRVWAVDDSFGPGWASEPELAQVGAPPQKTSTRGLHPLCPGWVL